MSEEEVFKKSFTDEHPANYDQQIEMAKELLLKSDIYLLIANEPLSGNKNRIHGIFGSIPHTDIIGFLENATETFQSLILDASEEIKTLIEEDHRKDS